MHLHLARTLACVALSVITLGGCGDRYGTSGVGGGRNLVGEQQLCWTWQSLTGPAEVPQNEWPFLAIVFWLQEEDAVSGGLEPAPGERLEGEVNGRRISLPSGRPGVYVLRPDYSVTEVELTPAERDHVLAAWRRRSPLAAKDELFRQKVVPQLSVVKR